MSEGAAEGSLGGRVVRGITVSSGGLLASQVVTLAVYLVLARLVTPADFGTVAAGMVVVGAGLLVAESGLGAALIHRRDGIEEAASTALVASLAGGVVLAGLAAAATPLVAGFFDAPSAGAVAAASSGLILLRCAAVVPDALLRRRLSFVRRTVVDPLSALAFGAASLPLCAGGAGAWGILAGYYASALTSLVLTWALARWRPRLRLASVATWRSLAGYGRHVVATEFFYRLAGEIDAVVVGRALGAGPLGQFRYASRVALRPLAAFTDTVSFVLFPALSRISGDGRRFDAALERALRWASAVIAPTTLLLLPLGEPLMVLVFGNEWRAAGTVLSALCGVAAGQALISIAGEVFKASGEPRFVARMQAVTTLLTLGLAVVLAPSGLAAVAAGFSAAALAGAAYGLCTLRRISTARVLAQVLPAFAVATAAAVGLLALDRGVVRAGEQGTAAGLALLAVEAGAALAVYVLVLLRCVPGARLEVRGLLHQVRRAPARA